MHIHSKSNIIPILNWTWIGTELELNWSCYLVTLKKERADDEA